MDKKNRSKQARIIRRFRSIHRLTGAFLFAVFIIISITGLLLGWKKNSNGTILPKTQTGSTSSLENWLPLDSLSKNACMFLTDNISGDLSTEIDRIDIRPNKGVAKFQFKDHYYGVQIDGATGELLQISKRKSDLIENIHDGSILDRYLGTSGIFKLIFTSISGFALLLFSLTGFWLWYGPKRLRKVRKSINPDV